MREYDLSGEWKFGLESDLLNDVIMLWHRRIREKKIIKERLDI